MSSKKTTSKAPAKASASEKKTAKPAPKKAPETKPVKAAPTKKAAPAKEVPAKKPAPVKPAAPVKAAPAKKPVVKKEAPAKKEPAKKESVAVVPAKKPVVKDSKAEVSKKPETPKKVEPAVAAASAKDEKASAPIAAKKPVDQEAEKKTVKAPEPVETHDKREAKKSSSKVEYPYSVLLEGGKKPCKFIMFVEIDEQEERANKKKVTSEMKSLEKKPTSAIRHKISLAEETQEELTERILKELEEQNAAFTREAATQICTRCNRNLVSPEFWVDKHLGYCEECATILHLGQSKEARKVEYQLGAMGGDSVDEADDDEFEGPDAADLKEAEEELADFDA